MTLINPYNFVPLKEAGPKRDEPYLDRFRFHEGFYRGTLSCKLVILSPTISLDHGSKTIEKVQNRKGEQKEIGIFKFLKNHQNSPIFQGSSIKGMIRSVYEAVTNSCMPFAATEGESRQRGTRIKYSYADIGIFKKEHCCVSAGIAKLCPACQLFGIVEGESVHCQGKVSIGDATLISGSLVINHYYLKELSSPKPHHSGTYGKSISGGGPIAGRKFYYHHGNSAVFSVDEGIDRSRSIRIEESAPQGCEFGFKVKVEDVSRDQLGKLLLAMELSNGLGHKIGVGKAIGLGSCKIEIAQETSCIMESAQRYKGYAATTATNEWYTHKENESIIPDELIEVLRLNKAYEGDIAYPPVNFYPSQPIDALGVFGGSAKKGHKPKLPVAPPMEPPPKLKVDEEAAWLRESHNDSLVFVTAGNEVKTRKRSGFQGKSQMLEPGRWFILSGTNASRRA